MPGRKRVYHSQPPLRAWSETEPPNLLAKGFALDIPSGYGSQKSGARSQNGPCVGVQQTAGFFECAHQRLGFAIAQILGEDQIVAAFFQRSLCNIQEPGLFGSAALTESVSDVGRDGNGSPTHLMR